MGRGRPSGSHWRLSDEARNMHLCRAPLESHWRPFSLDDQSVSSAVSSLWRPLSINGNLSPECQSHASAHSPEHLDDILSVACCVLEARESGRCRGRRYHEPRGLELSPVVIEPPTAGQIESNQRPDAASIRGGSGERDREGGKNGIQRVGAACLAPRADTPTRTQFCISTACRFDTS